MSEETSSTVGDPQGKNFRRAYYESLLFRGEEEEKNVGCLESLLKAACIDVESLKQFCQKNTLPPYHRLQVWNIILGVSHIEGVVPPYNDEETCTHDLEQSREAATESRADCFSGAVRPRQRGFLAVCPLQEMMDSVDRCLLRKTCFHYVGREDSALCTHLSGLSDGIPFSLWFNQCFASTLPETCLEGVWDRLIGGCVMILVFLAVAILLTFKRRLLGAKSSSVVADVLTQIPEENCVLIVMKAVELWEASGCPLLPSPSPHLPRHGHSND
ncbi:TBC1 domain family member 7 [Geodia barretti]|uniref:TBC1 domain family member 7 n=1 Tax=Geodia barretti TaxID=519541 RepID=A0AA35XGY6_GEOBA|nr:TBC1 domain family member 7 [Geodia barretti]